MQKTASLCPDAREAGAVHLMAVDSITCPDCGLVVRVTCGASRSRLIYDIKEWKRRCKRGDVDQPAWCFVQRDGTSPTKTEQTEQVSSA